MKVQKTTLNIIPFLQRKDEGVFPAFGSPGQPGLESGFVSQEKVRVGSGSLVPANVPYPKQIIYYLGNGNGRFWLKTEN